MLNLTQVKHALRVKSMQHNEAKYNPLGGLLPIKSNTLSKFINTSLDLSDDNESKHPTVSSAKIFQNT